MERINYEKVFRLEEIRITPLNKRDFEIKPNNFISIKKLSEYDKAVLLSNFRLLHKLTNGNFYFNPN